MKVNGIKEGNVRARQSHRNSEKTEVIIQFTWNNRKQLEGIKQIRAT